MQPPRFVYELISFADNFEYLLAISEDKLDDFVKTTHSGNTARTAEVCLLIPTGAITSLNAILFELKDRQLCNALPDRPTLLSTNDVSICILHTLRNEVLQLQQREKEAKLSELMAIVKLTFKNYQ